MKNLIIALGVGAFAATAAYAQPMANPGAVCGLLDNLRPVFALLRTLAFIGAAFIILGWGWQLLNEKEFKMDDFKKKGMAMLVGFILLVAVGALLTFIISATGANTMGCDFGTW
ncbi:MAG: hypothetical protein FWC83_00005 [Alphaproteobacteria bacterium]|nr:hypothetical protein [Alphaproteobacteria bacterium]